MSMPYRRLGRSGLKVSLLSFGSWVSFGNQVGDDLAVRCLEAAREGGINFFDNAEIYAGGESEAIMGRAIKTLGWARREYVISTKFFWGIHDVPNMTRTLNRKYLHAGGGRIARAIRPRLRRPRLLPSRRPADADRRDGPGDVGHRQFRQGALLGHLGVGRGRDRRRHRDR